MKRSILFDTETTGLDPATGDRVIEIAALELIDDLPTGETFHVLINPERDVPPEASRVHGFTLDDLLDKPKFAEIADAFLAFIGQDEMIAHNAPFDFGFINAELKACGKPILERSRMVDTLEMAKKRYPGLPNSLDALCRRHDIDLSARTTHNALLDCKLLSEVYLELMGGRQRGLGLAVSGSGGGVATYRANPDRVPRPMAPPDDETRAAHEAFVSGLKEPIWLQ
ncbi:DNA polymerase III subunit epsilon [Asaia sp. W19]|uniref:DNA polymerase III subunit epsilon n=1 Tax=unclassified Asaia TaxID=2685023 RepID=UPI000F8EA065|nr:DNA polymerase III subunit epsilon [Asaia sp. W19]RUT26591.1 DNA polymerase III subunit epsilon [Asaia sp. W19]